MNAGYPTLPINEINLNRVVASIGLLLPKNTALRTLAGGFSRLECLFTCNGSILSKAATADIVKNIVRQGEPSAIATFVYNAGDDNVSIYESEILVAILEPGESEYLAMPGRGRIWAQAASGEQQLTITTYRQCDCGIEPEADSYDNPVGAFLL